MKKITMKKQLSLVCFSLLVFAGCSDNVTDNDPVATQAYEDTDAFPACDKDYEGMFATVSSSQGLYICTADKWINLTTGATVADSGKANTQTGCTSKELADASGVTVFCNGDSVAVLKYGKNGAKGTTGAPGGPGEDGKAGTPGGQGPSGDNVKIDTNRCMIKYSMQNVTIYDCGDSTYVDDSKERFSKFNAGLWSPITPDTANDMYTKFKNETMVSLFLNWSSIQATGKFERFTGDNTWDNTGADNSLTVEDVSRDSGYVKGKATVTVTKAGPVTLTGYRPFVGVGVWYYGDASRNLGLCVTYSSKKEMGLLVFSDNYNQIIRASLPATTLAKESTVNLTWDDFAPVAEGQYPKEFYVQDALYSVTGIFVEVAGGDTVGTYENEFSLAELGDYGRCSGYTYAKWKAHLDSLKIRPGDPLVDTRRDAYNTQDETYPTIVVGGKTWMAANLRYNYGWNTYDPDPDDETPSPASSKCDNNVDENCAKFGRLYTWSAAMDSAGHASGNTENANGCGYKTDCAATGNIRGVCPQGWHLPSITEWEDLFKLVKGKASYQSLVDALAFFTLDPTTYNKYLGANLTGFNFLSFSNDRRIWSSTSYDRYSAHEVDMYIPSEVPYLYGEFEGSAYLGETLSKSDSYFVYVRCVKN